MIITIIKNSVINRDKNAARWQAGTMEAEWGDGGWGDGVRAQLKGDRRLLHLMPSQHRQKLWGRVWLHNLEKGFISAGVLDLSWRIDFWEEPR